MACILIVESNDFVAQLYSQALEPEGYDVIRADVGEGVVQLLDHLDINLVITAFQIPGEMDGVQLTDAIKGMNPDLPVLMISGGLLPESRADAALGKPVRLEDLLATVKRLLAK